MISELTPDPDVPQADAGPLGPLPFLSDRQLRLERTISTRRLLERLEPVRGWLVELLSGNFILSSPEIVDRPSGLGRPGVIAQFAWPARSLRFGLGIETRLAHALVDRMLGFERAPGEERLQVTPVEWGVLTYVIAGGLARATAGAWSGIVLDRVGPDPFLADGLGRLVTMRFALGIGADTGSLRVWLPVSMLPDERSDFGHLDNESLLGRLGGLAGQLRAVAGSVTLSRGLGRLRSGGVLPLDGSPLRGTVASPEGPVSLEGPHREGRIAFAAEAVPLSGGGRLAIRSGPTFESLPREPIPVNAPNEPGPGSVSPADLPVTLTVELGRVSLPLSRLADLKPGDVVELARHAREPVELTSNGKLVARGELVLIDTELGVRVTHVFL